MSKNASNNLFATSEKRANQRVGDETEKKEDVEIFDVSAFEIEEDEKN